VFNREKWFFLLIIKHLTFILFKMKKTNLFIFAFMVLNTIVSAKDIYVSVNGNNNNLGTQIAPVLTIQHAADVAEPGDIITVHAGTYRERINPTNGGLSNDKRIIFQSASGEKVEIKGSEIINKWEKVKGNVWKVTLPNLFFGSYNPYKDSIYGDWFNRLGRVHHTGEVYLNGKSLFEVDSLSKVLKPVPLIDAQDQNGSTYTWYCESNDLETTIWANFQNYQPNKELVEINVRPNCFYPEKTGVNFITISGFHFSQAATQWAPPTAEQPGLIGTNWSKGWIIENNTISDSKCSGITLGKDRATGQNEWSADRSKNGSQRYIEVIFRALKAGWNKENIGSHIVRNNIIYNCEQTGICGSLGAVYSQITGNHIYNINVKRQFEGAEIAGIKIHASVDMLISNNRIHNCYRGMWMDWMAQGLRISSNLLYDNNWTEDIYFEVNHGPYLVDNNILLSKKSIKNQSQGGAYVHNLISGELQIAKDYERLSRYTPYLLPHSTLVMGITNIEGGDDRWYNNILTGKSYESEDKSLPGMIGLEFYNTAKLPVWLASNLHYSESKSSTKEIGSIQQSDFKSEISIEEKGNEVFLHITTDNSVNKVKSTLITTAVLGKSKMADEAFENPNGSSLKINTDYFGKSRSESSPLVGPFEQLKSGKQIIKVW
jgi:hypothetical protein